MAEQKYNVPDDRRETLLKGLIAGNIDFGELSLDELTWVSDVRDKLENQLGFDPFDSARPLNDMLQDPEYKARADALRKSEEIKNILGSSISALTDVFNVVQGARDVSQAKAELESTTKPSKPRGIAEDPLLEDAIRRARELGSQNILAPLKTEINQASQAALKTAQETSRGQAGVLSQQAQAINQQRLKSLSELSTVLPQIQAQGLAAESELLRNKNYRDITNAELAQRNYQSDLDYFLQSQLAAGQALGESRYRRNTALEQMVSKIPSFTFNLLERAANNIGKPYYNQTVADFANKNDLFRPNFVTESEFKGLK